MDIKYITTDFEIESSEDLNSVVQELGGVMGSDLNIDILTPSPGSGNSGDVVTVMDYSSKDSWGSLLDS